MILFAINNPKPVPEYDFEANIEKPNRNPINQFNLYDPTTKEGSKHITYFITIKKKRKIVSFTYLYKHRIHFLQYYC